MSGMIGANPMHVAAMTASTAVTSTAIEPARIIAVKNLSFLPPGIAILE